MNEQVYLVHPDGTGVKRLTERRQGDQPPRALVPRRLLPRPRLERAQRRRDRLLRVRRRRRTAAPRHAEPRHRRVRRRDARQEARAPESPRQPRRQQPVPGRSRERQGDAADAARGPGLVQRRVREGRPRGLSRDKRRPRPHGVRAARARRRTALPARSTILAERPDARALGLRRSTTPARPRRSSGTSPASSELEIFDLATGKATSHPKLPAEIAFGLDFSRDGRTLAMALTGAATPADIWVMDVASGAFRQVTKSPHAGIDLSRLVRPELLRFKAHDGLELSGWLYRPRRRRRAVSDRPLLPRRPGGTGAARSSTAHTRRSSRAASPSSRRTSAARPASARNSSTSTTARCASRASRTSRTASTRS